MHVAHKMNWRGKKEAPMFFSFTFMQTDISLMEDKAFGLLFSLCVTVTKWRRQGRDDISWAILLIFCVTDTLAPFQSRMGYYLISCSRNTCTCSVEAHCCSGLCARSVFSWSGHLDEDQKEGMDHKERMKRRRKRVIEDERNKTAIGNKALTDD